METTDRERASDRQKEKRSVNTGLFFSRKGAFTKQKQLWAIQWVVCPGADKNVQY